MITSENKANIQCSAKLAGNPAYREIKESNIKWDHRELIHDHFPDRKHGLTEVLNAGQS